MVCTEASKHAERSPSKASPQQAKKRKVPHCRQDSVSTPESGSAKTCTVSLPQKDQAHALVGPSPRLACLLCACQQANLTVACETACAVTHLERA